MNHSEKFLELTFAWDNFIKKNGVTNQIETVINNSS
jgi:hypothetical protein